MARTFRKNPQKKNKKPLTSRQEERLKDRLEGRTVPRILENPPVPPLQCLMKRCKSKRVCGHYILHYNHLAKITHLKIKQFLFEFFIVNFILVVSFMRMHNMRNAVNP